MFAAYFDESGTPDESHVVLTVAGFVSTITKWGRFEKEWPAILKEFGLPDGTVFHMNRFASSQPPYDVFKQQSERKAALVSNLVACTKRNVNKAFSCSVALRDWESLNRRYRVSESLGFPYAFCGRTCVGQVIKWARGKSISPNKINFFFEHGAKHRGQLDKILRANDGIEPLFRTKEEQVQFQPADLLAWKHRKLMAEVVKHDGSPDLEKYLSIMRSLKTLNSIPHDYGVHTLESLEKVIKAAKIPLRGPDAERKK